MPGYSSVTLLIEEIGNLRSQLDQQATEFEQVSHLHCLTSWQSIRAAIYLGLPILLHLEKTDMTWAAFHGIIAEWLSLGLNRTKNPKYLNWRDVNI